MIELIKKAVYTGMGAVSLTKDKIDEFSRELISVGKLSEQEGEKLVNELRKKSDESKESLRKQTELMVEAALQSMQLAKLSDVERLEGEIVDLRKELEALKSKE